MDEDAARTDRPVAAAFSPPGWYCTAQGRRLGPLPTPELVGLVQQDRLLTSALVWREGMPAWTPMAQVPELAAELNSQGIPLAPPNIGDDAGMRMLLPVGRSWQAIVAGYLGLLSLLLVFAPLALAFGVWAIVDLRKNPKRHGLGRAIFGMVMGAVFTVVLIVALASRAF